MLYFVPKIMPKTVYVVRCIPPKILIVPFFNQTCLHIQAFLNMDKLDSSNFSDKFTFRSWSNLSSEFGRRDLSFCILVSHTGLVVALAFNLGQDQVQIS